MPPDTEGVVGSIVGADKSLSEVNQHALNRLDELIQNATPEEMPGLIESLAKYNSSLKGNDIFKEEDEDIKHSGRQQAQVAEILNG